jgi:hypothetical protein
MPADMSDLVFALPGTPSLMEIEGLLHIVALLGSGSDSQEFLPRVELSESFDLDSVAEAHVVAIGLPTTNPVIRAVSEKLPQPFLPDSNDIEQRIDNPIYAIPPGTDLGFLQELISPWSEAEEHVLLVVTGTTEDSLRWSLDTLAKLAYGLSGNLVIIRDSQIRSIDTRPTGGMEGASAMSFPTVTLEVSPVVNPTSASAPSAALTPTPALASSSATPTAVTSAGLPTEETIMQVSQSRPVWLVSLLVVCLVVALGVVAISVWRSRV